MIQKMGKKRNRIGKYKKISTQMKFQLVRSVQSNGTNLLSTSKQMRINYSTAKSILFQYRNRTIRNSALLDNLGATLLQDDPSTPAMAQYKPLKLYLKQSPSIQIISTLNGEQNSTSDKSLNHSQKPKPLKDVVTCNHDKKKFHQTTQPKAKILDDEIAKNHTLGIFSTSLFSLFKKLSKKDFALRKSLKQKFSMISHLPQRQIIRHATL